MRFVMVAAAVLTAIASGNAAAAAHHPVQSLNPANERLLKLAPPDRLALLARAVGHWCVATEAFEMGVLAEGRGRGNAYWSVRCADGTSWALQIDPLGEYTAIDCNVYKAAGHGNECFKKF